MDIKEQVINQVKNDIDYMSRGSYKINGIEHYTPVWYELSELSDIFNLFDYGFDLEDYDGFEDAGEVMQNDADFWEDPDAIPYTVSKSDVHHAKHEYNYLESNFVDSEILDVENFTTPRPLTRKDINTVFSDFQIALNKAKITDSMIKRYNKEVKPNSIINYAD